MGRCWWWMWENRSSYNGLSVLPFSDHTYKQAPFEDCSKETYEALMASLTSIDLLRLTRKKTIQTLRVKQLVPAAPAKLNLYKNVKSSFTSTTLFDILLT